MRFRDNIQYDARRPQQNCFLHSVPGGIRIASILVLAVVVAIVIARSGGSDVALVSPVARAAMALTTCAAEPQAFQ